LLVEEAHFDKEHVIGISAMKASVNEKFTILGLGTLCKQVQSNCYRCRIRKGVRLVQQMAPLPINRLEEQVKAFENCGMDFAGPFEAKVAPRVARKKVYILVITCLSTRAVHLETTGGMTTNDIIAALSRFCDLRGTPKTIITDNQPSFHKTDKDLHEWIRSLDWEKIEEETSLGFKPQSYGISWFFNPPYAPHFGGVFETIVKATKRALNAVVTKADLTEDEFRTVIYSVMSRLNDRPIALVGEEKMDLSPLTPNCFLTSHLGYVLLPPNNLESKQISPKERWKYLLLIRNHFWRRFSEEIIPLLRTRSKWSQEKENLEVDDVVIEFSENSPRHQWRMLRVTKIFPSQDGLVRKVEVVNSGGQTYERPITKLIPIVQN
jgi:transposase InsO family protein